MEIPFETLSYEKEDGIGIITLSRPKQLNAISEKVLGEIEKILEEIKADSDTRALIITGKEGIFCAGADIKTLLSFKTPMDITAFSRYLHKVFKGIEDLPVPVIAAINGLALGGGCELALACDIRIAASSARIGVPEIGLGAFPAAGGTQRLPRLIGVGRAKAMLYSGEPVETEEAYRIGLVNKVVSDESLMDEAKKGAAKLGGKPVLAFRTIKLLVNKGMNVDLLSALEYEAESIGLLFSTEDFHEGMRSFVEKRKPQFKGK